MSDDRGGPDNVPDFFLDDEFVAGARYREASATERAEEALREEKAQRAADAARRKVQKRDGRKAMLVKRRRLISIGVLVLLAVLWMQLSGSGADGAAMAGHKHVQTYYAVPSDAGSSADAEAGIQTEIGVVQRWFEAETGGRSLRIVESAGEVLIERKDLRVTSETLRDRNDASSLVVDEFLDEEGRAPEDTLLLVFVPLRLEEKIRCGEASSTGIAIIWMGSCGATPSAATTSFGQGSTLTIAHELVHALGAVAPCAPNYGNNGHVVDDPTDLMYDGGDGSRAMADDIRLDPQRDDYYEAGKKNCPSIEKSRLWKK